MRFHGLPFCLRYKTMGPGFICCKNPGQSISLSFKTYQEFGINSFSLGFAFHCQVRRKHLAQIFKYSRYRMMRLTFPFDNENTEGQLSGCDALILANNGTSTLQHLRTKICDRTARTRQIIELRFSCFESRTLFAQRLAELVSTVAFPQTFKRHFWMSLADSFSEKRNSLTAQCS